MLVGHQPKASGLYLYSLSPTYGRGFTLGRGQSIQAISLSDCIGQPRDALVEHAVLTKRLTILPDGRCQIPLTPTVLGKRAETVALPWTDEDNDASIYKESKAFHTSTYYHPKGSNGKCSWV